MIYIISYHLREAQRWAREHSIRVGDYRYVGEGNGLRALMRIGNGDEVHVLDGSWERRDFEEVKAELTVADARGAKVRYY